MHAVLLAAALLLVAGAVGTASATNKSPWRACGIVRQSTANGYTFSNRVETRDGHSCSEARHIGEHFASGGYSYRGLTCFYAPMGSGNVYWNWSCGKGRPGDRHGTRDEIRGHSIVKRVR